MAYEASEWDGTRFGREESTGVVMGLGWDQVIFLGVGVLICVPIVVAVGFPTGLLIALVIGGGFALVGIPRVMGKSLIRWAFTIMKFGWRKKQGQTEYVQPVDGLEAGLDATGTIYRQNELVAPGDSQVLPDYESVDGPIRPEDDTPRNKKGRIKPGKGHRFKLPGEINELRVFQQPGGAAFVYDPRRKEAVVVAAIMTDKAFALEAFEDKEDRLRAWAGVLSGLSRIPGVARLQFSDQTTIISGAKVMAWYERKRLEAPTRDIDGDQVQMSGPGIDPILDGSFVEMMNHQDGQSLHEPWLTIVLSQDVLARRIQANGGKLRGFMDTALGVMRVVESALPDSGTRVVKWHTPRSLAALIRSGFDPLSTMEISDREGDFAGVAPDSAGPMHAEWTLDRFESDGALHRSFVISEWPQAQAQLGFLDRFIFAGEFRHTVSLYVKPRDTRKALKDNERRKADWQTNETVRSRLGKQPSLRHTRQIEDIEREEAELVESHAPVKIACLITVSATTEQELEANCGDLRTRAAEAGCEIRLLGGEQDSGFIAGALPLGRLAL
ncbi:hypothetical protein GCM10011359_13080 [Nesterenkonia alkaliphila]|nr:hypothetical protein GCM10011359_13080 [Nesterenkonia alkaliphila]